MKRTIALSLTVFAALALSALAYATPIINSVTFDPSPNLQLNESVTINADCTEGASVYAQIMGEDGLMIPNQYLMPQGGLFTTTLNYFLFNNKPNNFTVDLTCENSASETYNYTTSFSVSNFSLDINSISPGTIYVGDVSPIEINVLVRKDNYLLSDGLSFTIKLNGTTVQTKGISYLPGSGWNLYIDRPSVSGAYILQVTAFYDRFNSTDSAPITVKDPIQFSINGVDNSWVKPNDTINLQIQASDKGSPIGIGSGNLAVQMGTAQANILSITPVSNFFNVAVQVPNIASGVYTMTATLSYGGYSYPATSTIYYITPIYGEITDENGKGMTVMLRFISGGIEKLKVYTDSNGDYSGNLPAGTYDVEGTFPQSTLYLQSATISSFNDPIKYFYSTSDIVPGIRNAGLFSYQVGLTYFQADIEAKYIEKNVLNENNIIVLKCSNWNSGRKVCNNNWSEIGTVIDTIRNVVDINQSGISTFVVGERKGIDVDYSLDSDKYYVSSPIRISGIVKDSDGNSVPNASVNVYVKSTAITARAISDNNGAFSIDLNAPNDEGNYTLTLGAERFPYVVFNDSRTLEVLRSRTVEIVTPDTIKLKQGQNSAQEISIVNTGQADLLSLNISLTGIPSGYFNLTSFIAKLGRNEEDKLLIYFTVPDDAEKRTYSANLQVSNGEMSQNKIFGLTVVDKNDTTIQPQNPSGNFILPSIDPNVVYIAVFAVICFSVAIILKKLRIKKSKREVVTGFLSDVKNNLSKSGGAIVKQAATDYKDLITSEFPSAVKDKDRYGKNN